MIVRLNLPIGWKLVLILLIMLIVWQGCMLIFILGKSQSKLPWREREQDIAFLKSELDQLRDENSELNQQSKNIKNTDETRFQEKILLETKLLDLSKENSQLKEKISIIEQLLLQAEHSRKRND